MKRPEALALAVSFIVRAWGGCLGECWPAQAVPRAG